MNTTHTLYRAWLAADEALHAALVVAHGPAMAGTRRYQPHLDTRDVRVARDAFKAAGNAWWAAVREYPAHNAGRED